MTSSRKFGRLLQAGCLGLIGMLAAAGCGGSSSPGPKPDGGDGGIGGGEVGPPPGTQLTVTPASVDLGAIDVGVKSTPVTVTVKNVGSTASGALTVNVSGTGITATGCSGISLASNATCALSITAQMAAAGPITGTIEVGDTALNTKKIAVSGIAIPPGGFTLTPAPLDLGSVLVGKATTGTVIMTNTSPGGLTGVVINVAGAGFTDSKTGTCTDSLPVGQTCTIIVGFTGTASGAAKGTLSVSQGGVTKPVALTAQVLAPAKLVMTPATASLQTVVGSPSSPVTFYVGNAGDVTSAIPAVTLTGAGAKDFSFVSDCPSKALPGGAATGCQVTVTYNPATAPATNSVATLTVAEPGTGGSSVTAALTGTAVPPSTLAITGTPVDLGIVTVGNTGTATTFTVTNNGGESSGALEISASMGQFVIGANTCTDKALAPKGTCTFTAAFKPAAGDAGVITAQLKAKGANTANPAFIGVTGTAVPAAKLAISATVLEFGSLPTMQESAPQTLTISNVGGAPTGVLKVDNTGAQFKVTGDTCKGQSLTATGATSTCTVTVTFTSTATDTEATGSIVVTDTTGAGGSVSASLHGTGIAHAGLSMSPSVICPQYYADDPLCRLSAVVSSLKKFKNKVVGQKTEEVAVTITNMTMPTTAPDSGVITLSITGDAKADFAIVQNNCTTLLSTYDGITAASGTSCLVTLTFTPSAVGLRKAVLALSTSRGGASQTTLEGKGLPAFELQPLQVTKTTDGLTFDQESLGNDNGDNARAYRVWLRASTATDKTSTVTLTLPATTPADFLWTGGTFAIGGPGNLLTPPKPTFGTAGEDAWTTDTYYATYITVTSSSRSNPCHSKTVSLAVPAGATKPASNAGYTYEEDSGYFYCDFAVQFYPNSARGTLTAEVNGNGTNSGSGKLTLTGQAVGPLVINPSPLLVSDPVAIGQTKTTGLTLTVTNNGSAAQTGLTFGLGGTGSADFQILGTSCWSTSRAAAIGPVAHELPTDLDYPTVIDQLASKEKCEVWVGFTPKTEAAYNVTLTVTAANGAGTADDETATTTIITNGLKTFGALTISPNPAMLADTPFGKIDAEPITLTIKNNGTLDTGLASMSVCGTDPGASDPTLCTGNKNFEIVDQTGVAGACNSSSTWRVPGGASCTIKLRAKPTSNPLDIRKQLITGELTVSATPGGSVTVPLTYYETSNIMVSEVGGTGSSTATYTFPALGQGAIGTHNFTVANLGSASVSLSMVNSSPFSVDPTAVTGQTICSNGFLLNAGAQCTLVIRDSHTNLNVTGIPVPVELNVSETGNATNMAKLLLSSITLPQSQLVSYGLDTDPNVSNTTGTRISLGTVPFGTNMQSGTATLWFRNIGGVETGTLQYKWDGLAQNTADPEFKIVPPPTESLTDCFALKKLQPDQFCSVSIYFKPSSTVGTAGERLQAFTLLDADKSVNPTVYLRARAVAETGSVYVQDETVPNPKGFFQYVTKATASTGESRTFRIYNNTVGSGSITLDIPTSGTFQRKTVTAADECGATLTNGNSCQFTLAFVPASAAQVFLWDELLVVDGGNTYLGLMGRTQQPAQLLVIPPVGMPELGGGGLDMLTTIVGGSVTQTLTVVNIGDVATTALTTSVGTPDPAGATFTEDGGCTTKNLGAFGSATDRCSIKVTATGTAFTADPSVATLTVNRSTGTPAVTVSYDVGIRVNKAAALRVSGTSTFPDTAVTGFESQTFTITNSDGTAGTFARSGKISVALAGAGASQFQLVGNDCPPNTGLASGATCTVTVRFMPTALSSDGNAVGATINVTADPGTAPAYTIQGMPKSSLTISPVADATATPLTQGIVAPPTSTNAVQTFTVTNDATADQTQPIKTSISSAEFMLINDECYGTMLNKGQNCIVSVKYIGASTNTAKTATLTINGGSAGQSVAVNVSYVGAAATTH